MAEIVIAFDLYGTLLSTESIANELARIFGEDKARAIATQARRYQLEYTWRINSMGMYRPFADLTRHSFRHATAEVGHELSKDQEERVMDAYNRLDMFADAQEGLSLVSQTPSLNPYIFSNGTMAMITSSLKATASVKNIGGIFSEANIVSVDPLQAFKPDPKTYRHMASRAGLDSQPQKVYLVSSNPFDAAGAVAAGLKSIWVCRKGDEWNDGLSGALGLRPTAVVSGVDEAVREIIMRENLDYESK
ncbi:hypothetical protein QQS21_002347 [Conoideocrella luteorostrata]|uniref:Haloacid dehalogenase n=1 Tax=Conoideocrella luteorostrata TaxID=1105319 RepID=A0AAJ0CVE7_9HYPO|nr:hypothetical protein QQS21_002347 [Conoideocrella luteorostrata]